MAVDSNVLIYERIREERRNGRSVIAGDRRRLHTALATIVDANLTTLIAAVDPVLPRHRPGEGLRRDARHRHHHHRLHRLHLDALADRRAGCAAARPKELPRGAGHASFRPTRKIPLHAHPALDLRAVSAALSIAVGRRCFFTVGLNYGIDFKGGTLDRGAGQGRHGRSRRHRATARRELNLGDVQVQEFGDRRDVLIRVGTQAGGDNAEQTVVEQGARRAARTTTSSAASRSSARPCRANSPGTGTIGVIVSLVGDPDLHLVPLRMAVRASAPSSRRVHDVDHDGRLLRRHRLEFNLSSIAAILTIVGYSLNDTVVVYDRIRENLRKYKKMPLTRAARTSHQRDAVAHDPDAVTTHRWRCWRCSSSAARSSAPSRSP